VNGAPIEFGADYAAAARSAAAKITARLNEMAARQRELPKFKRPEPENALHQEPDPRLRKYDPEEVLAVLEDRPPRQEKTEKVEAVVEPEPRKPRRTRKPIEKEEEPEARSFGLVGEAQRSAMPPPGRAFVSRGSMRERFL